LGDGFRQEEASAGEIISITGLDEVSIGDTVVDPEHPDAMPRIEIGEPTVKITVGVNSSPFAGREGKYSTSRQLRERLYRELEVNISLRVQDTDSPDLFLVSGRGELHLAILVETMRRQDYEFEISRPEAITREVMAKCTSWKRLFDMRERITSVITEMLARGWAG
jgi:GTP-binding protein